MTLIDICVHSKLFLYTKFLDMAFPCERFSSHGLDKYCQNAFQKECNNINQPHMVISVLVVKPCSQSICSLFNITLCQTSELQIVRPCQSYVEAAVCGAGRTVVFSDSSFILSYRNPVLFYFWKWHSLPFPHMCSDCPSLGSFCPSNKNKDFHSSIKSISRIILCKVEGLQLHSSSLSSMFRRHSHYFYLLLKTYRSEKKKKIFTKDDKEQGMQK